MIGYKKVNLNPLKNKCGDCVIKAISLGLNKDWFEVFDDLVLIARNKGLMPNSDKVIKEYLKNYPLIVDRVKKGDKRLKATDFKQNGVYIISQANHLGIIKDKVVYDNYDIRKRAIYKYWIIKGDEVLK